MRPSTRSSLQRKVFGLVALLVLVLVGAIVAVFPRQRIVQLRAGLTSRATSYAHILSTQLEPAIAFDDRETAREALDTLQNDPEVIGAAVFDDLGGLLASHGSIGDAKPPAMDPDTLRIDTARSDLRIWAPIVSKEGPRGLVLIVFSKAGFAQARRDVYRTTAVLAVASLAVGLVAAWLTARGITRRLARVTGLATSVARGDFDHPPIRDRGRDEVGQLAEAFDIMLQRIKALLGEREEASREVQARLEALVSERTADLASSNDEMSLVLENLAEGVLTIDAAGSLGGEHARIVEAWFGNPPKDARIWQFFESIDSKFASRFELAWESVVEGYLPLELALDQLPSSLETETRCYRVRVEPMRSPERRRFLVVIIDVTAERAREREAAAHGDLATALERIARDKSGFSEFLEDAKRLMRRISSKDSLDRELLRDLHTLKGNCGLVGLNDLARLCHDIESAIDTLGELPPPAMLDVLGRRLSHLANALGDTKSDALDISPADYSRLLVDLEGNQPRLEILEFARTLIATEPATRHLQRLGAHVEALAERSGKRVAAKLDCEGVRVAREGLAPFWSNLVHVVRNAVSHGIEGAEERERKGKSLEAVVTLRAREIKGRLHIEVEDDGRGISWNDVASRGRARGLPALDHAELVAVLCSSGFSTADSIDESAGRGEGLGALRAEVERLGGTMDIESELGVGARFICSFALLPHAPPANDLAA